MESSNESNFTLTEYGPSPSNNTEMTTSRPDLYCYVGIHLLFIFLISLSLGLCLTQRRCVFTVIFNDSDFEQVRDIVAPLLFYSALFYNVLAVCNLLQQLAASHRGYERRAYKQI